MKKLIEISAVDITIYKFVLPFMNELKLNGWNISVASSDSGYRKKLINAGYEVYNITIPRSLSPLKNIKALFQLINLMKEQKPYCIHTHTPIASILSRIAGKITKVPRIVYTLHGLYQKPPFIQLEKFVCRHCTDYIFTVNEADKQYLINKKFIKASKIQNLNSVGVDTNIFNPYNISQIEKQKLKKEFGIADKPVIGFVGRLVKEKGILELIDTFINIHSKTPCQLIIIGSSELNERDNTTIDLIKNKIKSHNLQKDIILAGHREDIALCLSVMDIFVLPSYREGMPISILEAMAMKLPVIATNIKGCKEEITPATGILVSVKQTSQLYNAIMKLLYNPKLSKSMGIAGRKRVQMYFSTKQAIVKQLEVFKSL